MSKKRIAIISGITGQDGSFLTELLLGKGYEVHGIIRRSSSINTHRIDHVFNNPKLTLHYGDVTDPLSIDQIVQTVLPTEFYHLAAQSHVRVSFDVPAYTAQVDAFGTLNVLEAIRKHCPTCKVYNAATSELFGEVLETPQTETTPFNPRSPYGVAKIYAFYITKNYRESYNMFAVNGILFNHESERRGSTFVTAKIVNGLYDFIEHGTTFALGNINTKRDWGYAKEYVEAMYLMLQQDKPIDLVIGSGETYSIKEFIDECITLYQSKLNKLHHIEWIKDNEHRDVLWDHETQKLIITIDPKYYRPAEVDLLLANPSKAKRILDWQAITTFKDLVNIMVSYRIDNGKI